MLLPTALRRLPHFLAQRAYYRYFHARQARWRELFTSASLRFAPSVSMWDLVPGDVISGSIAFTGAYEPALSARISALGAQGGTLVDVGANMGYFSLLWCAAHPESKVVAFEASPRNIPNLRRNIERNGFAGRVRIVPKAAMDRVGPVQFSLGPAEQTGWGGVSGGSNPAQVEVEGVRLDDEVRLSYIDVLKVDVEGADTLVLQGCEALLRARKVGVVFYEQNLPRMAALGIAPTAAGAFLHRCGYRAEPISADGSEWMASAAFVPD